MKLDALMSLISNYATSYRAKEQKDDLEGSYEEENFFSSQKGEKVVSSLFSLCDNDNSGDLSNDELINLIQKLESYSEFSGISFEDFSSYSDDVDLQGQDISINNDIQNQDILQYFNSNNELEFLLMSDDSVSDEIIATRSQLLEDIQANYESINALNQKSDLTSDEQKQLNQLLSQRQELLKKRDKIESELIESASPETIEALKNVQESRLSLNDDQLETLISLGPVYSKIDPDIDAADETKVSAAESTSTPQNTSVPYSADGSGGVPQQYNPAGTQDIQPVDEASTLEQLEQQKAEKEASLATSQTNLNGVIDGSNSELASLKEQENTAFEAYNELLATIAPELSQQLETTKGSIEAKEQEIAQNEIAISQKNQDITNTQMSLDRINGNISSCENAISSLESALTSSDLTEEKKAYINGMIQAIKTAMDESKTEKTTLETNLSTQQNDLTTLQTDLETKQNDLVQLNTTMVEIETQIDNLNNQELASLKTTYEQAKSDYEQKQTTLKTQYEGEVNQLQADIKELQAKIIQEENTQIEALGNVSGMPGTYTLNDQTYDTVIDGAELESYIAQIQNAGVMTKNGHGGMCLSFSYAYSEWFNGTSTIGFDDDAATQYVGASSYQAFETSSKETAMTEIANQLNSGVPVIIQVNGTNHGSYYGRHYVVAVGLRQGASNPPTESDLLIVDTYDGQIEGMGDYGSRFMTEGSTTKANDYDYRMYVRK